MSWLKEAMTPFFIRHLTTSAPVFFIREASSPTEISSGIITLTGAFLAISSWRRRIRSASSCLRLLEKVMLPRRWLLERIFSLPPRCWRCIRSARSPPRVSRRSSYLARFTSPPLRVSTIFFWGTRVVVAWVAWGALVSALGAAAWGWVPWGLAGAALPSAFSLAGADLLSSLVSVLAAGFS